MKINVETLAGTHSLNVNSATVQVLDPGGAGRDVELPSSDNKGLHFEVINSADASEALTVKDDEGATKETLARQTAATFICNGTDWISTGARAAA